MRQRSERASTGTGRRSSSDRSRRSGSIESALISQRYEALRRVLPEPAFVANSSGDLEILSAPATDRPDPLPRLIHGSHIRETDLPEPAKLAIVAGIQRALAKDDPVSVKYKLTKNSRPYQFEIRLTRLNRSEVLGIVRDVTSSRKPEVKQRMVSGSPASETLTVQKKSVTLKEVQKQIDQERKIFRHQISQELALAVMPIVARMKERARPSQLREAQFLEAQLNAILAMDIDPFWERYSALTPREMELCELLKGGLSSKQISQRLNVSLATVHKHREQIRRKLGFQHKRVNLSSYLRLHALPVRN